MTSLKITKERLEAQVEYEAWEQSDRRKKFDPAKAKLLSFRCRSMWNFLRCVPADFFAGARLHCRLIGQQTYELYNLFPLMTDALWDDLEQNIRPPAPQDVQITVCYLNFLFVTVLMLSWQLASISVRLFYLLTRRCSVELHVCTASYGGVIVPPGSPDEQLCGQVLLFRGASDCACQPGGRFFSSPNVNGGKVGANDWVVLKIAWYFIMVDCA